MIDLHLHTVASDGRSTPEELVALAAAAGLSTIAVTDHDTIAGVAPARAAAGAVGMRVVSGIEITAVQDGRDVHILGYFIDEDDSALAGFLAAQRLDRRRRVVEMVERLAGLGVPVDGEALMDVGSMSGRALGRPLIARALVEAGHARDITEAFDRFLAHGRPAFVARRGATAADVIGIIARAGGLASFAHPGKLGLDGLIPDLVLAGLAAIEAFHPDHARKDLERYQRLARDLGVVVTGGSDFHGPGSGRPDSLGAVVLPLADFEALEARCPRAS